MSMRRLVLNPVNFFIAKAFLPLAVPLAGVAATPALAQALPAPQPQVINTLGSVHNTANTSILGVVNRPTSPFVSGLATNAEDGKCAPGVWGRGHGGYDKTTGTPQLTVNYAGAELGADLACFKLDNSDTDFSVGVIVGTTHGDGTAAGAVGDVTFDQRFAGVYGTFSRGPLNGDLQLRGDAIDFGTHSLGIVADGTAVTATRIGLSGSLNYTMQLSDDLSLVPAIGFDVSRTKASTLTFVDTSSAALSDIDNAIVFAGATLAKTVALPDGKSAVIPFVTGTYYVDASPATGGTFTSAGGGASTAFNISSQGNFGELSAGFNYVRLLGDGTAGGPQQLTAAVRADARFGANFQGASLTGQLRLQY
jgi:hypothetical protein